MFEPTCLEASVGLISIPLTPVAVAAGIIGLPIVAIVALANAILNKYYDMQANSYNSSCNESLERLRKAGNFNEYTMDRIDISFVMCERFFNAKSANPAIYQLYQECLNQKKKYCEYEIKRLETETTLNRLPIVAAALGNSLIPFFGTYLALSTIWQEQYDYDDNCIGIGLTRQWDNDQHADEVGALNQNIERIERLFNEQEKMQQWIDFNPVEAIHSITSIPKDVLSNILLPYLGYRDLA